MQNNRDTRYTESHWMLGDKVDNASKQPQAPHTQKHEQTMVRSRFVTLWSLSLVQQCTTSISECASNLHACTSTHTYIRKTHERKHTHTYIHDAYGSLCITGRPRVLGWAPLAQGTVLPTYKTKSMNPTHTETIVKPQETWSKGHCYRLQMNSANAQSSAANKWKPRLVINMQ